MKNTTWQQLSPESGINNKLDQLFVFEGYPVLVHSTGQYPVAVNIQGETTRNHPYFSIQHWGMSQGASTVYTGISLVGFAGNRRGYRDALTLWSMSLDNVSDIAPYVALAQQQLNVTELESISAQFDAAEKRIAQGNRYNDGLSRDAYEAACQALNVPSLPDAQCSSWGVYTFPSYSADEVLAQKLAYQRWRQIDKEAQAKRAAQEALKATQAPSIPRQTGQLWEPCMCGREPIYMPLHLCNKCWPTA